MFVKEITLQHIKGFQDTPLQFPVAKGQRGGWYVLVGDNGTGKSTVLEAIALALAGPQSGSMLLPYPDGWVARTEKYGRCEITINAIRNTRGRPVKIQFMVTREPQEVPDVGYVTRPSVVFPRVTKA